MYTPLTTHTRAAGFLTMPMAIVVAGLLIAAAIFFGNGGSFGGKQVALKTTAPVAAVSGAPSQPALPTVGNFRPVDATTDHVRGADNASVTIIEYSDLECPFCKKFHSTMQQVMTTYPKDVRWVYRHAPLVQLHSQAPKEANATECASEQGKFWEMIDKIYAITPSNNGLNLTDLPKLAKEAGVANIAQFQTCLDSDKYAKVVADDLADAQTAGLRGTPYSVIIGPKGQKTSIPGALPFESVKATIDSLIAAK